MTKYKLAVLAAVPFLMASVAFAQQPPAGTSGSAGHPQAQSIDRTEWHNRMCADHYARAAGRLAYLEARLSLTEQQRPAFAKFRQAALDGAEKARAACLENAPKGDARPTVIEREARMEKMLTVRLDALKETRPALQALYDALTPAQREILDHAGRHGHRFAAMRFLRGHEGPGDGPGFGPGMGPHGIMGGGE